MHAPQHQAYQQQPGVAGGAVPAMDPYYAQYYMQQLYACVSPTLVPPSHPR